MRRITSVALFCLLCAGVAGAQTIETVAGGGPNNVPALNANVSDPARAVVDGAGDLYILSYTSSRVFKVDPQGQLTIVAGTGTSGFSGDAGPATSAALNTPRGLAVDANGNLYIADTGNNRVRKVDTSGIITTVAGGGACCELGDGGPATGAYLSYPDSVAVDTSGSLYIADGAEGRIRKVNTSGTITTVAGDGVCCELGDGGSATSAYLSNPQDVFVDPSGNFYIADAGNERVRKVNTSGIITTVAGGAVCCALGDGELATSAYMAPSAVVVDASGDIYISDVNNDRVRKVDTSGIITTVAGNGISGYGGDDGPAIEASLGYPWGLSVDTGGDLYIADALNNRIRKVDSVSGIITTVAGNGTYSYGGDGGPATGASLYNPGGVSLDTSGNLYIADTYNDRVRKVDASGVIASFAGVGPYGYGGDGEAATSAHVSNPWGVATDTSGNVYIADTSNNRIRKVDSATGIISTVAGGGPCCDLGDGGLATNANLSSPSAVVVDPSGNLYIADTNNNRIRKVDSASGIIMTVAGNGTPGFAGDDGPAVEASLNYPLGLAVDAKANLYIADTSNERIRELNSATGIITTVAGGSPCCDLGDGGPAVSAYLYLPMAVTLDGGGNLFIADSGNNRIRKVDASGTITTVAGNGTFGLSGDGGPATDAELAFPAGLAFNALGDLFIADSYNYRVRKVASLGAHPAVVLSSATISFPGQLVTTTSAPQTVTLTNAGSAPLDFTVISITGADAGDFSQTHTCQSSLSAGASCTLTVTFKPSAAGSRSGAISITDSAAGSPRSIALTGAGTDFSLGAASGASNSATVTAGQTATYSLQVTPTNGFSGTVALSCGGAPSLATCTASPSSVTVNGSAVAFTVTVTTTAPSLIVPQTDPRQWSPQPGSEPRLPLSLALALLALALAGLGAMARKRKPSLAPLLALASVLLIAAWTAACGGGGPTPSGPTNPGTPTGTSTLTVTGTSAGVNRITSLNLTVR